jgi:hypothetical protein
MAFVVPRLPLGVDVQTKAEGSPARASEVR